TQMRPLITGTRKYNRLLVIIPIMKVLPQIFRIFYGQIFIFQRFVKMTTNEYHGFSAILQGCVIIGLNGVCKTHLIQMDFNIKYP
ncbi:hypothetical protein PIB30_094143, partial [Stylosanthes scabra]|nr:hypothetical protein [Stylosanthes scabra]